MNFQSMEHWELEIQALYQGKEVLMQCAKETVLQSTSMEVRAPKENGRIYGLGMDLYGPGLQEMTPWI